MRAAFEIREGLLRRIHLTLMATQKAERRR